MATLSPLASAIRSARKAVGLNQAQLARRMGVGARAVYRWERDEAVPIGRNRSMLVAAIEVLNAQIAVQLASTLSGASTRPARVARSVSQAPAPHAVALAPTAAHANALELALLGMAHELDFSPRRLRSALQTFCAKLHDAGMSFDSARQGLAAWPAGASVPIFESP